MHTTPLGAPGSLLHPSNFFFGAYRADARECVLTRTANIDIAACTATRTATHTATQFYNSDELASRIAEAFRLFDTDSDGVVDFQVGAPRD